MYFTFGGGGGGSALGSGGALGLQQGHPPPPRPSPPQQPQVNFATHFRRTDPHIFLRHGPKYPHALPRHLVREAPQPLPLLPLPQHGRPSDPPGQKLALIAVEHGPKKPVKKFRRVSPASCSRCRIVDSEIRYQQRRSNWYVHRWPPQSRGEDTRQRRKPCQGHRDPPDQVPSPPS